MALPAFALFFHPLSWELVAAVALADIGIAAIGTLLAAIAAASRARELLLPLLFLPLAIPVVIGGVGASIAANPGTFLAFLALYDGVFAILSWASFEYVVTEYRAAADSAAAVLLIGGYALAFYWAPEDADQGFSQKIFYLHVPIALTAYACFGWGAWKALRLLWTGDRRYDLESYTAVHMGVIFGLLTLVTGSIWAKISWGEWWTWGERQLVLFLILFLFYSSYFMLRYSTEPGPAAGAKLRRLRAVRGRPDPRQLPRGSDRGDDPAPDGLHARGSEPALADARVLPHLPRRDAGAGGDALPRRAGRQAGEREPAGAAGAARMTTAEKYVTGAYLVLLGMLLVYLLIIALKVSRLEEELADLTRAAREKLGG